MTPNWFYYWLQTEASWANPEYDSGIAYGRAVYRNGRWVALIGVHANDWCIPAVGPNAGKLLTGIDLFADICRHEAKHVQQNNAWYPNGYDPSIDRDGDGIPNSIEELVGPGGGGPYNPYSWDTDGDNISDLEEYVGHTMVEWEIGKSDHEDWSSGGYGRQWRR